MSIRVLQDGTVIGEYDGSLVGADLRGATITNDGNGLVINGIPIGELKNKDGSEADVHVIIEGDYQGDIRGVNSVSVKGEITGNIHANGKIECGYVQGDVRAETMVKCGNVGGNAQAFTGMDCGDVGGNAIAGTGLHCNNVEGNAYAGTGMTTNVVKGLAKGSTRRPETEAARNQTSD